MTKLAIDQHIAAKVPPISVLKGWSRRGQRMVQGPEAEAEETKG